jgi:hypothetical protein
MIGEPMAEVDLEPVVLDVIRKQTGQPSAGPRSRFAEDLGLSANGRNALFAFLVEAFSARGLNLPSRGFYLTDFLECATPADVLGAIRATLSGAKRKTTSRVTMPAAPPARTSTTAPVPAKELDQAPTTKQARNTPARAAARKPSPKRKWRR